MSGLDEGVGLLEWDKRLGRFEEERENYSGMLVIAFLLGVLFGMFLVRFIIPILANVA